MASEAEPERVIMKEWSDRSTPCVTFKSDWRSEKQKVTGSTMTEMRSSTDLREVNFQTVRRKPKETQTEEEYTQGFMDMPNDDPGEVLDFIKSVAPLMLKELEFNNQSKAFSSYQLPSDMSDASEKCIHKLKNSKLISQIPVTGIAWNSSGSVLAVCYGRQTHDDWCDHKGSIATWSIDKPNLKADKPDQTFDIPACATSIVFHPHNPAILTVASYVGKIFVYDLTKEEDPVLAISSGELLHSEPITQLIWVPDISDSKKTDLLSASIDGRIIHWELDFKRKALTSKHGYLVGGQLSKKDAKAGAIFSLSFNTIDRISLMVGTDSGNIFKCQLDTAGLEVLNYLQDTDSSIYDPIRVKYLDVHSGPVTGLDCSPHHHGIFISCSADGLVCLFNVLQNSPIVAFESSDKNVSYKNISWSKTNPLAFFCATENHGYIYHLKHNLTSPVVTLSLDDSKPITCASQNPGSNHVLALGSATGLVHIWHVSKELFEIDGKEEEFLNSMAQITTD